MAVPLERTLQQRMPEVLKLAAKFPIVVSFRNVRQRFANGRDIVSTEGSYRYGGRYNVARDFGILYLSCDIHTCIGEFEYYATRIKGAGVEESLPRTITGIRLELQKVLDLTDGKVLRKLGVTKKILVDTDWIKENNEGPDAPTQIIGRAAKAAGFEALLVPSARCTGKNLNLLADNVLLRALVINVKELRTKRVTATRRSP
jgi:RES domain-containing protein